MGKAGEWRSSRSFATLENEEQHSSIRWLCDFLLHHLGFPDEPSLFENLPANLGSAGCSLVEYGSGLIAGVVAINSFAGNGTRYVSGQMLRKNSNLEPLDQ